MGPGRTALQDNELVAEIILPAPLPHTGAAFFRRTRTAMDIAVVCGATMLQLSNGTCQNARIALRGGWSNTAARHAGRSGVTGADADRPSR